MKKYTLYILFICLLSISCNEKRYAETKSYVYRTSPQHWGRGNFKLEVRYRYLFNGKSYKGSFTHDLGRLYSKKTFEKGDSILLKVREDKPWKSEFIRMSYDKDLIEGLIKVDKKK